MSLCDNMRIIGNEEVGNKSISLIRAAGGIVERTTPDGPEIVLVHRMRYGSEWCLPKGKVVKGESWEAAALREVKEETGFDCAITGFVDGISYLVNGVPKVVLFWKMSVNGVAEFIPNDEVDKLEWLKPEEAISRVKHREEIELIKQAYLL